MSQIIERLRARPVAKQFVKFCIVGATAATINFSFLVVLTELFGVWYVISSAIGVGVSALFNFFANKWWTFRNPTAGWLAVRQLVKFALVMTVGIVINSLIIYWFTDQAGFDYRLSWVAATGVVTIWNYMLNRFWTFRVASAPLADQS